jgi:hypothetical protein
VSCNAVGIKLITPLFLTLPHPQRLDWTWPRASGYSPERYPTKEEFFPHFGHPQVIFGGFRYIKGSSHSLKFYRLHLPPREGGWLSQEMFVLDLCFSSAKVPLVMLKVGKWHGTSHLPAMAVVSIGDQHGLVHPRTHTWTLSLGK